MRLDRGWLRASLPRSYRTDGYLERQRAKMTTDVYFRIHQDQELQNQIMQFQAARVPGAWKRAEQTPISMLPRAVGATRPPRASTGTTASAIADTQTKSRVRQVEECEVDTTRNLYA